MPEPTETTIPHEFKITAARVNGAPVTFAVASSAGADGATVVFIDTGFEPDGSDGGPGLRIILNDHDVFEGVPYLPGPDDEAPLELNLDKIASMDVPTGDATFDTTDGGEVKAGLYVGDLRRMLAGVPDDTLVVVATDGWYQHVQSIVRPDATNEHVAFTLYPDFGPDGGFDPRDV